MKTKTEQAPLKSFIELCANHVSTDVLKPAMKEYASLLAVESAAKVIHIEMGKRISQASFSEFSESAKDRLNSALATLSAIRAKGGE